uniref:Ribosomal RNA-processing protein 7 C-terminal domain-containing protein n=2 Tax=Davidia involucrata TaxID=16924 RepID=A0A5B6ZQF5_DAVIN
MRKLRKKKGKNEKMKKAEVENVNELYNEVEDGSDKQNGKSKKARTIKKKDHPLLKEDEKLLEKRGEDEEDEVYQISSGDEDCSRGMRKWITEYYQSRPGLKILQERIDDFISAHEAQEEQAREEREARAAEGGWTVVVHHKGRKKTTDSESGVTVGSVAPAAVLDKMAKKKSKEVGLDFYRFQKREAQRNEIMMLQSKFEQDKKRIQQLRAARKFRPY